MSDRRKVVINAKWQRLERLAIHRVTRWAFHLKDTTLPDDVVQRYYNRRWGDMFLYDRILLEVSDDIANSGQVRK